MRQVCSYTSWSSLRVREVESALMERAKESPKLGDLTVRDLCCLAKKPLAPVGSYIVSNKDRVLYKQIIPPTNIFFVRLSDKERQRNVENHRQKNFLKSVQLFVKILKTRLIFLLDNDCFLVCR